MPKTKQFKSLIKSVEDTYLGKKVKKKYQNRYGKVYDEDEILPLSYSIARSRNIKTDVRRKK
jgi:hypothetical protein